MSVTIKTEHQIELMREAGRILAIVHEELAKIIDICKEEGIEVTNSMLERKSSDVLAIINLCDNYGIKVSDGMFKRDLQEITDIVNFCAENNIFHKQIRPKTPWHNGKVERSHRSDQERFYNHLSFYSFEDLQLQMKNYLRRSNRIPMSILGWKSPIQRRIELLPALLDTLFG